jgi:hypothetical protein
MYKTVLVTLAASALSAGAVASTPAARKEPLDAATLSAIKSKFGRLMELANNHDFIGLHRMFWQSPSTLLVAKSAIQSATARLPYPPQNPSQQAARLGALLNSGGGESWCALASGPVAASGA